MTAVLRPLLLAVSLFSLSACTMLGPDFEEPDTGWLKNWKDSLHGLAAGTLDFQALARLQVYLWVYTAAWLVLTFFVLPMFVAWSTPFSYREVMKDTRTAMITAFAAGTVLVVIPVIIERTKALLREHGMESREADTAVDVLVPTAYTFPTVGTLLGIGFILFSGWFVGAPIDPTQYPGFVATGAISAFGTMAVALPFMLDYFHLPSDLFQLYLIGSVMTARFAAVLATMHAVVISLLGASIMLNRLKRRGLFRVLMLGLVVTVMLMWGRGKALSQLVPYTYTGYDTLIAMHPLEHGLREQYREDLSTLAPLKTDQPRLKAIMERGALRTGFPHDALPFAFRNKKGEVVGLDTDLLRILARKLNVKLEIVRLGKLQAAAALHEGRIDIFMGSLIITTKRALKWQFSDPYIIEHLGFLVPDYRRKSFSTLEAINQLETLNIGVPGSLRDSVYAPLIQRYVPHARIVTIDSPREFFTGKTRADVMMYSAESAATWTLIYPDYSIVVPQGLKPRLPLGLVLPPDEDDFLDFINLWLRVERSQGTIDILKEYWIYGDITKEYKP